MQAHERVGSNLWLILFILFLPSSSSSRWNLAIFGPLPARIDRLRGFVCADFYYSHPDLISEAFDIRQSPCTIPKIERKLSTFTLLLDLTHALAAALGLLVYSSLISTKGRKPVFLIGNLAGLFHLLPYALLPLGYPFTSKTEAGLLNPRTSLYLLYTFSLLAGLLAFEDLAPLVSKALLADISSPQNRMRNLTVSSCKATLFSQCSDSHDLFYSRFLQWLLLAMLISVSLGPILFSAIIEFLPPLTASSLIGEPVDLSSHNNILPFLVGMLLQVASALWISLLVPETVGLRDVEKPTPHTCKCILLDVFLQIGSLFLPFFFLLFPATETSHPSRLSVLSILLPKKIPLQDSSSSVQKDWRLTRLTLVGQAGIAGSMGLQSLILFVGYLGWTAADVGIIISWMGTVRALVLILLVPSTLAWLSRIVKKPKELSDLSSEEMERIGKAPLELEEILEREDELEEDITSHQQVEGESEVIEAEAQELSEMQENLERDESLRKQLSLWKANVDLLLLKGSFL